MNTFISPHHLDLVYFAPPTKPHQIFPPANMSFRCFALSKRYCAAVVNVLEFLFKLIALT